MVAVKRNWICSVFCLLDEADVPKIDRIFRSKSNQYVWALVPKGAYSSQALDFFNGACLRLLKWFHWWVPRFQQSVIITFHIVWIHLNVFFFIHFLNCIIQCNRWMKIGWDENGCANKIAKIESLARSKDKVHSIDDGYFVENTAERPYPLTVHQQPHHMWAFEHVSAPTIIITIIIMQ